MTKPTDKAEIEPWAPNFYPVVAPWAAARKIAFPAPELLPNLGLILGASRVDWKAAERVTEWKAAIWWCVDVASQWAWIPFFITNNRNSFQETRFFGRQAVSLAAHSMKTQGARFIQATVRHDWLAKQLEQLSWSKLESGVSTMFVDLDACFQKPKTP